MWNEAVSKHQTDHEDERHGGQPIFHNSSMVIQYFDTMFYKKKKKKKRNVAHLCLLKLTNLSKKHAKRRKKRNK